MKLHIFRRIASALDLGCMQSPVEETDDSLMIWQIKVDPSEQELRTTCCQY